MRSRLGKDRRRQQLIEAATRVFARIGYASADISDIVVEAGVVRGTFYLYFKTKRELLQAVVDQYLDYLRQLAPPVSQPGQSLRSQLTAAFAATLRHHATQPELALVVLRDGWAAEPEITDQLRAAGDSAKAALAGSYRRLMERGLLRAVDSHLAATAVGGLLREVLLHEILLKQRADEIDSIAAELAGLVHDGLGRRGG
jgi:AcrR family transcriptional regulator